MIHIAPDLPASVARAVHRSCLLTLFVVLALALLGNTGWADAGSEEAGASGPKLREAPVSEQVITAPGGDRRATAPPGALTRPPTMSTVPQPGSARLVPTPELLSLAAALSADSLLATVSALADGFPTRYTRSDYYELAAALALTWFSSYGLDQVYLDSFTCCGGLDRNNVVGVKTGLVFPDEIIVVGAHLDCTSRDPWNLAPGAEDNASGSAAVLEMARIMAPLATERTIQFVLFGGEEQGLHGSDAFAQNAAQQNLDIVGALILDMVGYYDPAGEDLWLEGFQTGVNSMWLVDLVRQHAETYSALNVYVFPNNGWGSDHQSFHNHGFVSILSIENEWDSYPCYHRTCDTPDWMDGPFLRRISVSNATAALELAVPAFTLASISGTVDLVGTGDDSGATVTVLGTEYPPAVSSVSGSYLLPDILPGSHTLLAEHAGYLPETREVVLASGENLTVDFALLPEANSVAELEPVPSTPVLQLGPASPNPFRSVAEIPYTVTSGGKVWLRVVDARGRMVRELLDGAELATGDHLARWDGRDARGQKVASGIFWVELRTQVASSRLPIVRVR
jgi:hypothetical protein